MNTCQPNIQHMGEHIPFEVYPRGCDGSIYQTSIGPVPMIEHQLPEHMIHINPESPFIPVLPNSISQTNNNQSKRALRNCPQLSVKQVTRDNGKDERSTRRKQATQREKRRMEKLNSCIEDIRTIVCPEMKTPTKAKILREAINRIEYLERITQQMLTKYNGNVELALPGFKKELDRLRENTKITKTKNYEKHSSEKMHAASTASGSPYTGPYSPNSNYSMEQSPSPGSGSPSVEGNFQYSPQQNSLPSVESFKNPEGNSPTGSYQAPLFPPSTVASSGQAAYGAYYAPNENMIMSDYKVEPQQNDIFDENPTFQQMQANYY